MKHLLNKFAEAMLILLVIFVLGLFVPMMISILVSISSEFTLGGILSSSVPFWIGTIIGWLVSAVYINHALTE